jgi:hypothetical protein
MVAVQPGEPLSDHASDSSMEGSEEGTAVAAEPTAFVSTVDEYEDDEGDEVDVMAEFARHSAMAVSAMGYDTGPDYPTPATPEKSVVAAVPGWSVPAPATPEWVPLQPAPTTPLRASTPRRGGVRLLTSERTRSEKERPARQVTPRGGGVPRALFREAVAPDIGQVDVDALIDTALDVEVHFIPELEQAQAENALLRERYAASSARVAVLVGELKAADTHLSEVESYARSAVQGIREEEHQRVLVESSAMVQLAETCSRKVSEQRHVAEQQHREIVERMSAQHEAEIQVGRATIQHLTKEVNELKSGYAAALEAECGKVIHFQFLRQIQQRAA